jgi:hypothetical protein
MLIPQATQSESQLRQGGRTTSLNELRQSLAKPTRLARRQRQRLLDLVQRLDRVRALGGEYAGVTLSESAAAAAGQALVH